MNLRVLIWIGCLSPDILIKVVYLFIISLCVVFVVTVSFLIFEYDENRLSKTIVLRVRSFLWILFY